MNIAEETAAMRAKAGVRSITSAQLKALADGSVKRAKATAALVAATTGDAYSNPPDGYRLALDAAAKDNTPSPAATVSTPSTRGFDASQEAQHCPRPGRLQDCARQCLHGKRAHTLPRHPSHRTVTRLLLPNQAEGRSNPMTDKNALIERAETALSVLRARLDRLPDAPKMHPLKGVVMPFAQKP